MATPEQIALLRARLNAGASSGGLSDIELGLLYDQASEQLARYAGNEYATLPESSVTRWTLDVADRLHALEVSPGGIAQYDTTDAAPIGISRDPLIAVYPQIDRFLHQKGLA